MKGGLRVATGKSNQHAMGIVVSNASAGEDVGLTAIEGIVPLQPSKVLILKIPGVQPCTFIIICSGGVFGPVAGFVVGAMTPLVSNFFLGHGPWTLYQMIAWGLAGLTSGYLGRMTLNRPILVALGIIWGYLYGLVTNLWFWTGFVYPLTFGTIIVTEMNSIWFDTLHAVGNAVFLGALGMNTIAVLNRFRERFSVTILR